MGVNFSFLVSCDNSPDNLRASAFFSDGLPEHPLLTLKMNSWFYLAN